MKKHHSSEFESVNAFGRQVAAAGAAGELEMITMGVYPTGQDYHKLRPDLRHIPHEDYLLSMAGGVEAAKQHGLALLLKDTRADSFFAWLKRHGLENSTPHFYLYVCFAPVLEDQALLSLLGVPKVDPSGVHLAAPMPSEVDPRVADMVEKRAVQFMVATRTNQPMDVLTHLHFMVAHLPNEVLAKAGWALADRLGQGMPCQIIKAIQWNAVLLSKQFEDDLDRN